ncbi:MAG: DUF1330 domain-containing protein [Planctomycetes bacterium]|jgi:uncharacterized protein (DUF1330 family)|nr:DUF1330 domain-containing protein [Planctomycetota bacterium]MCC7062766.1 DUF1330 domain-containing protein [Planctomycetota bacterium]
MTYETMVGLTVTDDASYQRYRDAMAPLLALHGGGFRYDFTIDQVLKSASEHPINRVFAIYFGSKSQMEAFFAHPDYLQVRATFFEPAVKGVTIFGSYEY